MSSGDVTMISDKDVCDSIQELAELYPKTVRPIHIKASKPDLVWLVDKFSAALLAKLRAAEVKYHRKDDWLSPDWQAECQRKLLEHVAKGDPLDVAAYAAFCWFHGWPTCLPHETDGA